MKKFTKLLALILGLFAGSIAVYWFNLDNKLIYYVIRPLLNKVYDNRKRNAGYKA